MAGLLLACPIAAPAQDTGADAGGLIADLRFSQRLTSDDDGQTATTGLGLSVTSATPLQTFEFVLDGGVEQSLDGGRSARLADPSLRLGYRRETLSSALDVSLRYRETDVDSLSDDDGQDNDFLVLDEGTRKDLTLRTGFVFGRDAPFGGTLDLGYETRAYADTTDPDLVDEQTASMAVALRFDLDPRISTELRTSVTDTERDDPGDDVRTETLGAAVNLAVTQTLTSSLYLGQTRVIGNSGGVQSTDEGLAYTLSFTEERPNGTLSGSLASDIDESGRRTIARIDRSLELPGAALAAGVGVSEGEDDRLRPLLSLSYGRELPRGTFEFTLDQAFDTDSDGAAALNSRLGLSYRQDLTALSSLQAGLSMQDTDYVTGVGENTTKIELDLVYRHALTRDWNMVGGYTHTISREEGNPRTHSDEVFVGLEKSIQWRF